jgi:hypothetical protein
MGARPATEKKGRAHALGGPSAWGWVPGPLLKEGRARVLGVPTRLLLGDLPACGKSTLLRWESQHPFGGCPASYRKSALLCWESYPHFVGCVPG